MITIIIIFDDIDLRRLITIADITLFASLFATLR